VKKARESIKTWMYFFYNAERTHQVLNRQTPNEVESRQETRSLKDIDTFTPKESKKPFQAMGSTSLLLTRENFKIAKQHQGWG